MSGENTSSTRRICNISSRNSRTGRRTGRSLLKTFGKELAPKFFQGRNRTGRLTGSFVVQGTVVETLSTARRPDTEETWRRPAHGRNYLLLSVRLLPSKGGYITRNLLGIDQRSTTTRWQPQYFLQPREVNRILPGIGTADRHVFLPTRTGRMIQDGLKSYASSKSGLTKGTANIHWKGAMLFGTWPFKTRDIRHQDFETIKKFSFR